RTMTATSAGIHRPTNSAHGGTVTSAMRTTPQTPVSSAIEAPTMSANALRCDTADDAATSSTATVREVPGPLVREVAGPAADAGAVGRGAGGAVMPSR